jgi:hypothetical protein
MQKKIITKKNNLEFGKIIVILYYFRNSGKRLTTTPVCFFSKYPPLNRKYDKNL